MCYTFESVVENEESVLPLKIIFMKYIVFFLALAGLTFASSCKKDGNNDNNNTGTVKPADITGKTRQQVFMIQKWNLISWRDSSHAQDSEALSACDKDDTYEFKSTTKFTQNRGTKKCSPSEKLEEEYSWSMASANDTKVTIFGYTYDIVIMTGSKIELRRLFPVSGGLATQIVTFQYAH